MISVTVHNDLEQIKRLSKSLSKAEIAKAANSAINKSIVHGRSVLNKKIRQKYNLTSRDVMAGTKIFRSNTNTLTAKVEADRTAISLTHFKPIFNQANYSISIKRTKKKVDKVFGRTRKNLSKGLTIEVIKGRRLSIPYAFIFKNDAIKPIFARGNYGYTSGGYSFIKRHKRVNKTGSDTPVSKLFSTSIAGSSLNTQVRQGTDTDLSAYFVKSMLSYVRYRLGS